VRTPCCDDGHWIVFNYPKVALEHRFYVISCAVTQRGLSCLLHYHVYRFSLRFLWWLQVVAAAEGTRAVVVAAKHQHWSPSRFPAPRQRQWLHRSVPEHSLLLRSLQAR